MAGLLAGTWLGPCGGQGGSSRRRGAGEEGMKLYLSGSELTCSRGQHKSDTRYLRDTRG